MKHELQLTSDNTKIERICDTGRQTRKTNCTATMNYNYPPRMPRLNAFASPWRRTRKTNCTATMNYNYIHHISRYAPIGYAIVRTTGTVEPRSWHNHAPQLRRPMNGNKSRTPSRANMRTKGRAPVQTTTRTTAASPDTRRRHGPYIAPTAAPV